MNLITISEIDSTGPVRAISEGRVTAARILQTHPLAAQFRLRHSKRPIRQVAIIRLCEIPPIVAAARRHGWIKGAA